MKNFLYEVEFLYDVYTNMKFVSLYTWLDEMRFFVTV